MATATQEKSEFEALGHPVPERRIEAGYKLVKDTFGLDSLTAMSIIKTAARAIERDNTIQIIGENSHLSEDMRKIDLTGRYRLLAVLLTN